MRMIKRHVLLTLAVLVAGAGVLAGDGYAQTTSVIVVQPSQRVYSYPEGRYELRGDGTTNSPYYWVWIPTGVQVVAPPPAPTIVQQTQRVYTYPEGRYELRGDGTASSPHYWVWIPTGVQAVPAPPPLPTIVQPIQPVYAPPPPPSIVQPSLRVYTYPEGRYELRGDGTTNSPYYWVWIPTGVQSAPPPPPLSSVQPSQRVFMYADGRYELRGDGTTSSPYYWVWIPAGTVSQAPPPRYQFLPDLKSTEGQVDSVNAWARRMTVNGKSFEFPDTFAMSNMPTAGQQVMVTYYVAQDGRNIVRSIEHNSPQ